MKLLGPLTLLPTLFLPLAINAAPDLSKRSTGIIILWSDANYQGSDQWCDTSGAGNSITACQNMYYYMNDAVSSYQIYNSCCTLYVDGNCQGTSRSHCSGAGGTFEIADLLTSGFNDRYSSFKCSSQY